MLTVSVLAALPDLSVLVNALPQSIAVDTRYDNPDVTGTVVRFTTNQSGSNNLIYTELFDQAGPSRTRTTPLTAANFLAYANAGQYTNTFIHRSVPGFVVQGGGFTVTNAQPGISIGNVTQFPAVVNEPKPAGSSVANNVRGTIAMAKLGSDPNSATNQWFFNLADNSFGPNGLDNGRDGLDNQNGGFTVFGRVLGNGMAAVDAIAQVPRFGYSSPFDTIPLRNVPGANPSTNPSFTNPAVDTTTLADDQFVKFLTIAPVGELVYSVTSSAPALVSASFDSAGKLVLTYGAGVGTATVTVRASSVLSESDFVEDTFNVKVGTPTAPAITSVVAGNAQTALAWTASTSPSSASVANYLVKYASNGGATWTNFVRPASTATACTVTGLTNGLQYIFKVVAQNSVGSSLPSATSLPVTPATVPSRPTAVVAVRGNASLAVSWATPASTGGLPITEYLVKYSSNNGATWTTFVRPASTATSVIVTGLTNGLPYVFKVVARNAAGISLPSANSAPATPATVPGSPTAVVAVSGNASLAVSWAAPASTGGSPITDYLVKYSSNNGVTWTTFVRPASTATSVIVTSLTNGLPHVFKVIARNAVGISLPSATSLAVTPALPPT